MTDIGKRIKEFRIKNNLTQKELADKLNISVSALSNYETGYNVPTVSRLDEIAKALKVPLSELIGDVADTVKDFQEVYVVKYIKAGMPEVAVDSVIDKVFVSKSYAGNNNYVGLLVSDDSMNNARIHKGDIVIVKLQNYAENRDIVVVTIGDNDAVVRRYYDDGAKITFMPDSTNPKYKSQTIDPAKDKYRIIGKVVQSLIKFE